MAACCGKCWSRRGGHPSQRRCTAVTRETPGPGMPTWLLAPTHFPGLSLQSSSPALHPNWKGVRGQDWPRSLRYFSCPSLHFPILPDRPNVSVASRGGLTGRTEDTAETAAQDRPRLPSVYQPLGPWARSGELAFSAPRGTVWFGDCFHFTTKMSGFPPPSPKQRRAIWFP